MHVKESGTSEWCIPRFRFHHFIFIGLGEGGYSGACDSYSQRRRSWCACQAVGIDSTSEVLYRSFGRCIFPARGTGADVIGVALYSAATLLVCMPAGRKDKRANFRFFALAQYWLRD